MPTYEYRCKACGADREVVQAFTDDALTTCEDCGGPLRKLFGNVGIAFKGTGFYKNDSRTKPKSTSGSGSGSDKAGSDKAGAEKSSSDTGGSDKGSGDKVSSGGGAKDGGASPKSDGAAATPAKKTKDAASSSKAT